jgi:hypothetical protein
MFSAKIRSIRVDAVKNDKSAEFPVNVVKHGYSIAGLAGNEKILMPGGCGPTDDVLQINSTAGALGVLADYMKNSHLDPF